MRRTGVVLGGWGVALILGWMVGGVGDGDGVEGSGWW